MDHAATPGPPSSVHLLPIRVMLLVWSWDSQSFQCAMFSKLPEFRRSALRRLRMCLREHRELLPDEAIDPQSGKGIDPY
jgi:hypothetical protein